MDEQDPLDPHRRSALQDAAHELGPRQREHQGHGKGRRGVLIERSEFQHDALAVQLNDPAATDAAAEAAHFQRVADLRPQHLAHVQESFARDHRAPVRAGYKNEVAILQ